MNSILTNMVLFEEAKRQGYGATQAEIDEMVDNAKLAYSLPDGNKILTQYCDGAGITPEEYFDLLEKQAPRTIARQKFIDSIGKAYCEEHGLTFTKVNPPKELTDAQDAYVADLFEQAKDEIVYYTKGIN